MKNLFTLVSIFCLCFKLEAQELKVQTGHSSFISGIAFNQSGSHIISGGIDGQIKIWEAATGREIKSIATGLPMYAMGFSSTQNTVVIADYFSNITFWDLKGGKQMGIAPIKYVSSGIPQMGIAAGIPNMHTQYYRPIAVKDDLLAVANEGDAMANILKVDKLIGIVSIYEVASGKKKLSLKQNKGAISALAFSENGILVGADVNGNVKVWDVNKGKEIKSISSGQSKILSVDANDQFIISGGASGSVKIWDLNSGKNVHSLSGHQSDITSVSISSDGRFAYSCDKNSTKGWDLSSGTEVYDNSVTNISGGFTNIANVVKSSPDNSLFASSLFGTIELHDSNSKRFIKRFEGNDSGLIGILFFPGTTNPGMLYMGADKVVAKGWDFPNATARSVQLNVAGKMVQVHPKLESVIAWYPGVDKTIDVYDFETGSKKCQLQGHTAGIHRAIYSQDGSLIITGSQDNSIRIWDSNTGYELNKVSRRGFSSAGFNGQLFISEDNKKVLVLGVQGIQTTPNQLWDLDSKRSINISSGNFIGSSGTLSPNGELIAGLEPIQAKKATSAAVTVYNSSSGDKIHTFEEAIGSTLKFSSDSKLLAISTDAGVVVMGLSTGSKKFLLEHDAVNHIAFSRDGTRILTSGLDGISRMWDAANGNEIAGFVSFRDEENTIVLPNRYYYSTKGAVDGLHYVIDDKAVPFDQFDLKFNRPDLVFKALGIEDKNLLDAYKKAYLKRLKKNGLDESMLSEEFHLPAVEFSNSDIPVTTNDKNLSVSYEAKDSKYALKSIVISVNNVPLFGKSGMAIEGSTSTFSQSQEIELSKGRNKISIMAINEKGNKSIEDVIEVEYLGPVNKPDLYILAIGVSEFQTTEMNLTYAAKDATDVIDVFKSNQGRYGKINEFKFLDAQANADAILNTREVLMNSKVDDEVVIFVASHGLLDKNLDYYLAMHGVDFLNPSSNGLKYENLEGLLDGIPARKKLMLIDACHSGEIDKDAQADPSMTASTNSTTQGNIKFRGFVPQQSSDARSLGLQNSFALMHELFSDLRRGTGAVVISSAGGAEYAFESPEWNNGVFTYALLEGIRSGNSDIDKNKEIAISELKTYVFDKVVTLTNGNQHPTSRNENLEFDFRIW